MGMEIDDHGGRYWRLVSQAYIVLYVGKHTPIVAKNDRFTVVSLIDTFFGPLL